MSAELRNEDQVDQETTQLLLDLMAELNTPPEHQHPLDASRPAQYNNTGSTMGSEQFHQLLEKDATRTDKTASLMLKSPRRRRRGSNLPPPPAIPKRNCSSNTSHTSPQRRTVPSRMPTAVPQHKAPLCSSSETQLNTITHPVFRYEEMVDYMFTHHVIPYLPFPDKFRDSFITLYHLRTRPLIIALIEQSIATNPNMKDEDMTRIFHNIFFSTLNSNSLSSLALAF